MVKMGEADDCGLVLVVAVGDANVTMRRNGGTGPFYDTCSSLSMSLPPSFGCFFLLCVSFVAVNLLLTSKSNFSPSGGQSPPTNDDAKTPSRNDVHGRCAKEGLRLGKRIGLRSGDGSQQRAPMVGC